MSNSIFPSAIPGIAWDVKKSPIFANIIQIPANLRNEVRVAVTTQPQWRFEVSYEFLREDPLTSFSELSTIEGFYLARGGNFDSFLLDLFNFTGNVADHAVTTAPTIQAGDGVTTVFKLMRNHGGFQESVDATSATGFSLYVNGTLQGSGYTIQANTGYVTFTTAPAAAAVITWTGSYFTRVRFADSQLDFNLFQSRFWDLQKLVLLSVAS